MEKPQVSPETVCQEADRLVSGERGSSYGHPLDDFSKTAAFWSVILGTTVTPQQVSLCMAMVKVSRELNRHKRDNLVDLCGYAKCLELVIDEAERRAAAGWMFHVGTGKWLSPEEQG